MPPGERSRHLFTELIEETDESGNVARWLTDRIPFGYRPLADNIVFTANDGDTFDQMAGRLYKRLPRACGLWWVIADFQPEPVHDPTLVIPPGKTIHAPSLRTVTELILSPRRRLDAEA